ncbi:MULTISPECIES: minor capsid protein [Lactobacillaceae]|uniref:minor capsid protein n=1 Tax=Lactobacillaceae TaxID=33958 RepID=UPI001456733A|nr:minor capsid protein [Lactobacillus sp. HBUAS51381]NLR08676.1 minor capsid protein [Lactobacillus sp. HBUAS51381]
MTKASTEKYWKRRHLQVKAKEIKNAEAYEKALQSELNGMYRELHAEMEKWYVKYANNQGMTKEEAVTGLADVNSQNWGMTLERFERNAKRGRHTERLDEEYYRSRVARLQDLEQQLRQVAQPYASREADRMRDGLANQFEDTYMRTNYTVQASKGAFTANFAHFNEAQLRIAVSTPWGKDGKDFSKRIWKNYQQDLPKILKDSVLTSTLMGYSPQKASQLFHAKFQDFKKSNVHRLVTSEMGHIAEEAAAKGYEENEIEWYEYMATLESHTCDTCGRLDGQKIKLSERKDGINYPLIHPYCRCTTVPYLEDLPDITERWSRDPETGKGKMIKDVKFNEWKKSFGAATNPVVTSLPGIDALDSKLWPKGLKVTGLPDGDMVTFDSERGQRLGNEWLNKLVGYEDEEDLSYLLPRGLSDGQQIEMSNWLKQVNQRKQAIAEAKKAKANALMTDDDIMNLRRKVLMQLYQPTEAEISRVGRSLYERRFEKGFSSRQATIDKQQSNYSTHLKEYNAMRVKYQRDGDPEFYKKVTRKYNQVIAEQKKLEASKFGIKNQQSQDVKDMLSKFRVMGRKNVEMKFAPESDSKVGELINKTYDYYPSDWFDISNSIGTMKVFETDRGYYRHEFGQATSELALSNVQDSSNGLKVAFHELGHRNEHLDPRVTKLEHEFYQRRTYSDRLEKLSKVTGNKAYDSWEKTRKDNFLSPYMGKDYGNTEDSAYELLSMGLESVYRMSYDVTKDKDYAQFILGILAIM